MLLNLIASMNYISKILQYRSLLLTSIHFTVFSRSSHSDKSVAVTLWSNAIALNVHWTSNSWNFTGWSVLKLTEMSFEWEGSRWPIRGENLSCGWSGQTKRKLSTAEWFASVQVRDFESPMKQLPNLIWLHLAAERSHLFVSNLEHQDARIHKIYFNWLKMNYETIS